MSNTYYNAINWNAIEDAVDKSTWEKLTEQFWLDTRVPISNDLDDWRKLSEDERDLVAKVFGGLTLLDTVQSESGMAQLKKDSRTPHEAAVLNNIEFMEGVHAKSYSSIFSTLNTKNEIEEIFEWVNTNEYLQKKAEIINEIYKNGTPLQKKVASVFLETFLFYSGFYTPLYYLGNNKLPNVAEIIKLIIRDECLTADHELLTPTGWKSVKDIRVTDKVLQYDPETEKSSFVNPITTSTHFEPEIHRFYNHQNHINLKCSPNHRIITRAKTKHIIETASEYKKGYKNWINSTNYINPHGRDQLLDIERFAIAVHADGSYPKEKNKAGEFKRTGVLSGTIPVRFSFTKKQKIDRLLELSEKLKYKVSIQQPTDKDHRHHITVYVDPEIIPSDRVKRLPFPPLTTVSQKWCKSYIDEVSYWDTHVINEDRFLYGTTDPDAANIIETIANIAGYKTHHTIKPDNRKETYKDYHKIHISKHLKTTNSQAIKHDILPGEDVYGVQVPSGYLLTRNNGSIFVTGNSVHGTYIGYKFQLGFNELSESEQQELKNWMYDLLYTLYENEEKYTHHLYDKIGWTEDVLTFIRYNANKALMNLGQDPLFTDTANDVNPIVMNGISTGTANHDFFSQVGNGYLLGQVEPMQDSDYHIGK